VALEYMRSYFPAGFPWMLLGYALTDFFPVARLSQWAGVYGLSYLLMAFSVGGVWLVIRPSRPAALHLLAVVGLLAGLAATSRSGEYAETERALLVQTNIPIEARLEPWELPAQAPLLNRLWNLTVTADKTERPALIIWPEMPVPFYYGVDSFTRPYADALARETESYFLMGSTGFADAELRRPTNSAILLDPSGNLVSRYDKMQLVPFGEYVPFRRWLTLAERLTGALDDFVPGTRAVVNQIPADPTSGRAQGSFSTVICYEAIFPGLVRNFVRNGAELLVTISNDGWYGSSAARDQHLLMARMRAIENDRYFLRTTNTGITAVIRPDGQVSAELPPDEPAVLEARWSFRTGETFYTRYGDWFAWLAAGISLLALLASVRARPE
jgi:apolipoprotein N-acyltransferase